ncbi:MAG: glycosyltransferase family 4 protein [Pseudomonadota bacterium]
MQVHWVQPGPPEKRTGGFIYNNRIVTGLREKGIKVQLHQLSEQFPVPTTEDRRQAKRLLRDLPTSGNVIIDGLAFGVLADELADDSDRLVITCLCHHPLALELKESDPGRQDLLETETAALRHAKRVITTSTSTITDLAAYEIAPAIPIIPVLPGVDIAPIAAGSGDSATELLCVASLTERKGHAVLLEALAKLTHLDWHLTCPGGSQHEPETAAAIGEQIHRLGLEDRVDLVGELDHQALGDHYNRADIFVLPSHHEGYGMVLVEAMARGLPIISTTAGAIPEVVPKDAGILVAAGDVAALCEALSMVITDRDLCSSLTEGARSARKTLRTWDRAVDEFAEAMDIRPPR